MKSSRSKFLFVQNTYISNLILRSISSFIDAKLKSPPSNVKEIYDLISGDDIEMMTTKIMLQSYDDFAGEIGLNPELSASFLSNISRVIVNFRSPHNYYQL